ncbi:MAG: succinate dehydrogenase cytochrome b subunit [Myxococcales bacterium]|nr:succinate dehydrogenase cytochrome b subunit [Myxococcales bacterium]
MRPSSVTLKLGMAGSGLVLVGFVVFHLAGNLLIFAGPEALDGYAHFLQHGTHGLVWLVRLGLLAAAVVHVGCAVALTRAGQRARPQRYRGGRRTLRSTFASRTMRIGGPLLLLFIVGHLAHLTLGWVGPHVPGQVYDNVVNGFSHAPIAVVYLLAVGALGLHLHHGIASAARTLGLAGDRRWRRLAAVVAGSVVVGNAAIVLAVCFGVVGGA